MTPGKVYKRYACGCVFHYNANGYRIRLNELTATGNPRRIKVCPTCKTNEARFVEAFKVCPECGKTITRKTGSLNPGRCQACGYERYKELRRGVKKADKERRWQHERRMAAASRDRYDCENRDRCLDMADKDDKYLPCFGCAEYRREVIVPMVQFGRFDPYEWAYGEAI